MAKKERKKLTPEERKARKEKRKARPTAAEKLSKKGMELKPYTITVTKAETLRYMSVRIKECKNFTFYLGTWDPNPNPIHWTTMTVGNIDKFSYNGRTIGERAGGAEVIDPGISLAQKDFGVDVPADIISLIKKAISKHVIIVKDQGEWRLSNDTKYVVPIKAFEKIKADLDGTHMAKRKRGRKAEYKVEIPIDEPVEG